MTPRLRLLLAVSLLLNLFAAGVIAGGLAAVRHPGLLPHAPWHPRMFAARPIRGAGDALPQPDRARFRAAMRATLREAADLNRAGRDNRAAAAALFTAPAFDADGVLAALARARAADVELRARLETEAVAFAATLPLDERISLAQGLARAGPLRHPGRPATGLPPPR